MSWDSKKRRKKRTEEMFEKTNNIFPTLIPDNKPPGRAEIQEEQRTPSLIYTPPQNYTLPPHFQTTENQK